MKLLTLTAAALLAAVTLVPARAQAPMAVPASSTPARSRPLPAPTLSDGGSAFVRDSLDAYIRRGMRAWNIPGLAVAIVKDGQVVVSKGYGVREAGRPEPVDQNTLFYIASNTKLLRGWR